MLIGSAACYEITYFWEGNRGKTCFVENGPVIIDFLKNAVAVMTLVENGLGMSHFWWKTADMLIVAGDGPELMVNLHCLYCCESFGLMSLC